MITTEIIKAHLAGTVLPQPNSRANTSGMSKVMFVDDKAPIDERQTPSRDIRSPTLVTAATSEQEGSFSLSLYLAHLETQQNTIEKYHGTNVKDILRVVEDEPKKKQPDDSSVEPRNDVGDVWSL
jgi:hypothetical protein